MPRGPILPAVLDNADSDCIVTGRDTTGVTWLLLRSSEIDDHLGSNTSGLHIFVVVLFASSQWNTGHLGYNVGCRRRNNTTPNVRYVKQ